MAAKLYRRERTVLRPRPHSLSRTSPYRHGRRKTDAELEVKNVEPETNGQSTPDFLERRIPPSSADLGGGTAHAVCGRASRHRGSSGQSVPTVTRAMPPVRA